MKIEMLIGSFGGHLGLLLGRGAMAGPASWADPGTPEITNFKETNTTTNRTTEPLVTPYAQQRGGGYGECSYTPRPPRGLRIYGVATLPAAPLLSA